MSETKKEAKAEEVEVEVKTPNIYQRLQSVRKKLTEANLKKTGKNQGRSYFELGDFLPFVTKFSEESGIMPQFLLQDKRAVLHIFNVEYPADMLTFYVPIAEAKVPGAQPVQNLGAQITYLERYLYMIAFEIAETDAVDASKPDTFKEVDQLSVDKINAAKTNEDLLKICGALKKTLGKDFEKGLMVEYTRRKSEIEKEINTNETS